MHWFTVFLQFASFYTIASAAAWFDKRRTDIITPYSHSILQDTAFIGTVVVRTRFLGSLLSPNGGYDSSFSRGSRRFVLSIHPILARSILTCTCLREYTVFVLNTDRCSYFLPF